MGNATVLGHMDGYLLQSIIIDNAIRFDFFGIICSRMAYQFGDFDEHLGYFQFIIVLDTVYYASGHCKKRIKKLKYNYVVDMFIRK